MEFSLIVFLFIGLAIGIRLLAGVFDGDRVERYFMKREIGNEWR